MGVSQWNKMVFSTFSTFFLVIVNMAHSRASASPATFGSSLFPLSLMLGDDFSAYEFFVFMHSPGRYLNMTRHRSLWFDVLCSPDKLNLTFQFMPETNLDFLSAFMCRHLRRNSDRISVFDLIDRGKPSPLSLGGNVSLTEILALTERFEDEV